MHKQICSFIFSRDIFKKTAVQNLKKKIAIILGDLFYLLFRANPVYMVRRFGTSTTATNRTTPLINVCKQAI